MKVHARKIKASDDVDFHTIARMASGASGAELANIVNEAALRAVRDGRTIVTEADLEESIEVVIAGYQKKNAVLSDQEKKWFPITKSDMPWWQPFRAIPRQCRRSPSSTYFRCTWLHHAGGDRR